MVVEAQVDDVTRLVEGHARAQQRLLTRVLRALLGLWRWRSTRHDPVLSNGAVAESILLMMDALEWSRDLEVAFVTEYASALGVEYDAKELFVDPVYVRDADFHDVYARVMDEYRWQRYGRPHRWSEAELESAGFATLEELLAGADEFDAQVKLAGSELDPPSDSGGAVVRDVAVDGSQSDLDERQLALDDEAFEEALRRMETIAEDDLLRAADKAHLDMLDKKSVWLGYRRVIHPELSETGTCGLCVVASTRVYGKKMLAPMHSHCKCTTIGVSSSSDVGRQINQNDADQAFSLLVGDADGDASALPFTREDLDALYEEAGSTYADDLREYNMDYGVNENGPTIVWRPSEFKRGVEREREFTPESLSVTRQKWERTRLWAGEHYESTLAEIERLKREGDPGNYLAAYEAALRNFETVAARMGDNLRTYRLG